VDWRSVGRAVIVVATLATVIVVQRLDALFPNQHDCGCAPVGQVAAAAVAAQQFAAHLVADNRPAILADLAPSERNSYHWSNDILSEAERFSWRERFRAGADPSTVAGPLAPVGNLQWVVLAGNGTEHPTNVLVVLAWLRQRTPTVVAALVAELSPDGTTALVDLHSTERIDFTKLPAQARAADLEVAVTPDEFGIPAQYLAAGPSPDGGPAQVEWLSSTAGPSADRVELGKVRLRGDVLFVGLRYIHNRWLFAAQGLRIDEP
jgi:hypothetical protein